MTQNKMAFLLAIPYNIANKMNLGENPANIIYFGNIYIIQIYIILNLFIMSFSGRFLMNNNT